MITKKKLPLFFTVLGLLIILPLVISLNTTSPHNFHLIYNINDSWLLGSEIWINGTIEFQATISNDKVYYEVSWRNATLNISEFGETFKFNETIKIGADWDWFEMQIYKYAPCLCPHSDFIFVPIFNPAKLMKALQSFAAHHNVSDALVVRNGSYIYFVGYIETLARGCDPHSLVEIRIRMIINKYGIPIMIENEGVRMLHLLKEEIT